MFAQRSLARRRWSAVCALLLVPVLAAARPAPRPAPQEAVIHGGVVDAAKAAVDTVLILGPQGSGAAYFGTFQDFGGSPAWNGWTHQDLSVAPSNAWHADTYHAVSGAYSAWCGEARFAACDLGDEAGGYGNNYDAVLEWRGTVADPGQPCTVAIAAVANIDLEPGYDYLYVEYEAAGGVGELLAVDDRQSGYGLSASHQYQPGDYVGPGGDEVVVRFRVRSDAVWSDEDCLWPTAGAVQLDDVVIALDNGAGMSCDFEDGTLGPFTAPAPVPAGDFTALWTGLEDYDPCRTNYSTQVAFVDDGVVVPGTGGSFCINWCYGPNGYIVNTTGGLAGEDYHLDNALVSPVMAWPEADVEGALLSFDVYVHETLSAQSPGVFYSWAVRSVSAGDPAAIADAPWRSDNFLYYGGPAYRRDVRDVSALLVPDPSYIQVRLRVADLGWQWGWTHDDATPAPYFDNVRLQAFALQGPSLSVREAELAHDAFPSVGLVDSSNMAAASVRFDMADLDPHFSSGTIHGDSLALSAVTVRAGAVMADPPRLHYRLKRNPVFDGVRTSGLPDLGSVACAPMLNPLPVEGRWTADLPDEGFLFPGDVLHYYFAATDAVGAEVRTATLPADTTGFSAFGDPRDYDARFTMRALPSYDYGFQTPRRLFWYDGGDDAEWQHWLAAWAGVCALPGYEYDIYRTQAAGTEPYAGLGGATDLAGLMGYDVIYYAAGGLDRNLLTDGSEGIGYPSEIDLLAGWLDAGKALYLGGDQLAYDLSGRDGGLAFLNDDLGISPIARDLRPLIGAQLSPKVLPIAGNPVLDLVGEVWLNGGCPTIRTFNAVQTTAYGQRIAQFANASGAPGGYVYSAMTACEPVGQGRCLSTPYDLAHVVSPGMVMPLLLLDFDRWLVGNWYWPADGLGCVGDVGDDPAAVPGARFGAAASPNPFNPKVTIAYTVARAGHLTVKIFDVRGRLVRTVLDGRVEHSGSVDWNGRDDAGGAAASGVYFYEVRMDNDVQVGKLALIR